MNSQPSEQGAPEPRIINAPKRIWLQVGCDDEFGEIDFDELSTEEISWCSMRMDNTDIEYTRSDICATLVEALKACERYFAERANPGPDVILRRQYRIEAEKKVRTALTQAKEGVK